MFQLKRFSGNPILVPEYDWEREGVFNPGVVRIGNKTMMLYRAVGEKTAYISRIGLATSDDGYVFSRSHPQPVFEPHETFDKWATEDPRITQIDDDYYITYVAVPERIMENGHSFPRTMPLITATALLRTRDFLQFENHGIISPEGSDNKDIVLFPKKINGRFCMLHRPNLWDTMQCKRELEEGKDVLWPCYLSGLPEKPAMWISWSDDLLHWTDHDVFMKASHPTDTKIGPGLPPIETPDGWLLIYHHVISTDKPDSYIYTVRAALFDLHDPKTLIGKLPYDILAPEMPYEKEQNSEIVFPTGGYIEGDTLFVYYGASDRYVCLATGSVRELLEALKQHTL